MKLGDAVQISIGVPSLAETLPFYEGLGFRKIYEHTVPYPVAQLSDGVILVLLNQDGMKYSGLIYFAADMPARVAQMEQMGIQFVVKATTPKGDFQAICVDPNGLAVALVGYDGAHIHKPSGQSFSRCGTFGEFSIRIADLPASMAFWDRLGFDQPVAGGDSPYPWAVVSDGLMRLGLHQSNNAEPYQIEHFHEPTITYFSLASNKTAFTSFTRSKIQTAAPLPMR